MRKLALGLTSLLILSFTQIDKADSAYKDAENLFDCNAPEGKFEFIVCANGGMFDTLNHHHQLIYLAEKSPARTRLYREYKAWIATLAKACGTGNIGVQSRCIGDSIFDGPDIKRLSGAAEALYAGESDIEGDEECDGCEQQSPELAESLSVPLPRKSPSAPTAESAEIALDENIDTDGGDDASPMDIVKDDLAAKRARVKAKIVDYYAAFWRQQQQAMDSRHLDEANISSTDVDSDWVVVEQTDPLTEEGLIIATKSFDYRGATLTASLSCETRKKQLEFSFTDTMQAVSKLGLPSNAAHVADLNVMYVPAPAGFDEKYVFNSKPRISGRTAKLIGFNQQDWGISFCESTSGIADNVPFCHRVQTTLPKALKEEAAELQVSVPSMKDRDIVPESWKSFAEVRVSMRTVWGNPSIGDTVPAQYFFKIEPNRQPLRALFMACERSEDRCVPIYDQGQYRGCKADLNKDKSRHG